MNIILFVGILLVLVSIFAREKLPPYWGFLLVFLIMGFQDGVEGDYMTYKDEYEIMVADHAPYSRTLEDEPVMPYIESFFASFCPFWVFVVLMSLFQCFVIVEFVRRYAPKRYQSFAAVLFFFTFNMMLLQMKAMRQGLAIELMMFAFLLADGGKERWLSILVVLMAYFTHNSALVVIPFYVLFFVVTLLNQRSPGYGQRISGHPAHNEHVHRSQRLLLLRRLMPAGLQRLSRRVRLWTRVHGVLPIVMVSVYLVMYVFKITVLDQYLVPLMLLIGQGGGRLTSYADGTNYAESLDANLFSISPLIVLYDAVIIFLVSDYYKSASPRMRVFCIVSLAAAFGDMLFFGAGSFARIIMYYVVFNLAVYPAVALHIRKKYGKYWVPVFIVFLIGYAVKTSLPWMTEMEGDRFGTYRFVFLP